MNNPLIPRFSACWTILLVMSLSLFTYLYVHVNEKPLKEREKPTIAGIALDWVAQHRRVHQANKKPM